MPEITRILHVKQGVLCLSDNRIDMICLSKIVYFQSMICIVTYRNKIKLVFVKVNTHVVLRIYILLRTFAISDISFLTV